jgi:indole-3-glycerol phosphate synthase
MSDILKKILATKAKEVAAARAIRPPAAIEADARAASPPRDFVGALRTRISAGNPAVIAEIKKASPSRGVLRPVFDPAAIARRYEARRSGVPVGRSPTAHTSRARANTWLRAGVVLSLPVLRRTSSSMSIRSPKRAIGADYVLLIVAALDDARLAALGAALPATAWRCWPRCTTRRSWNARSGSQLRSSASTIATCALSRLLETTLELLPRVPPGRMVITESGIVSQADVARMRAAGVHAFLVGRRSCARPTRAPRFGHSLPDVARDERGVRIPGILRSPGYGTDALPCEIPTEPGELRQLGLARLALARSISQF